MKLVLKPDANDARRVRELLERHKDASIMQDRIRRNLASHKRPVTRNHFWQILVSCLTTTQQRSSPGGKVDVFCRTRPFPLRYSICGAYRDVEAFTYKILRRFGLRRTKSIAREVAHNFELLENGFWPEVSKRLELLRRSGSPKVEREVADFIDDNLLGFGPKQSRNLLQWLGLTKFETPVDSRVTKWLNDSGFPFPLSASLLADRRYYHFVSDSISKLCSKAGVFPCVFDAAVFASFDDVSRKDRGA